MVKYHKVGTSFILADFILNLNTKSSKPRQKRIWFHYWLFTSEEQSPHVNILEEFWFQEAENCRAQE